MSDQLTTKPLQDELDRTAVLSPEFKQKIIALAMEACRVAYERGRAYQRERGDVEQR